MHQGKTGLGDETSSHQSQHALPKTRHLFQKLSLLLCWPSGDDSKDSEEGGTVGRNEPGSLNDCKELHCSLAWDCDSNESKPLG